MTEDCKLRAANELHGVPCDGPDCLYWRLVDHLGIGEGVDVEGCAIQHFSMLEGGREIAAWLLSVKQRTEAGERNPFASDPADASRTPGA